MEIWQIWHHAPAMFFVFCVGAAVASFVNVVVGRLPIGMSLVRPGSRCPTCGIALRFFRENLPILGWIFARGKCRNCQVRIPAIYLLIEVAFAFAFLALYVLLYIDLPGPEWIGEIGGQWWRINTFYRTWPMFFAFAGMFSALYAMFAIDAKTYTIPIQIPIFLTALGIIAALVQSVLPIRPPERSIQAWPIAGVDWKLFMAAIGGAAGTIIANVLLMKGVIKRSFDDYEDYVTDDDPLASYPHARREMKHEVVFILPIVIGMVAGWFIGSGLLDDATVPPRVLQALGTSVLGYLVGGAVVWAIRMFGTLGFGKEAMGIGDVHLLAAVGAVVGWVDPFWIFMIAPMIGIAWYAGGRMLGAIRSLGRYSELPFGPSLAIATLIVFLAGPAIRWFSVRQLRIELAPRDLVRAPGDPQSGRNAKRHAPDHPERFAPPARRVLADEASTRP